MLKHIPFYASLLDKTFKDKTKPKNGMVLVYGAVEAHSFGEKGCIASNKTIADECGLKEGSVATYLSAMAKEGWVRVYLDENNHRTLIVPLMVIEPPFHHSGTPLPPQLNIGNSNKNTVIEESHVEIESIYDLYISEFNSNKNLYKLTPNRKTKIKARLKDAGAEMLSKAIKNTAKSKFHRGENDRGWRADLDFIIKNYEQVEKLSNMTPKVARAMVMNKPTAQPKPGTEALTDEQRKHSLDRIRDMKNKLMGRK